MKNGVILFLIIISLAFIFNYFEGNVVDNSNDENIFLIEGVLVFREGVFNGLWYLEKESGSLRENIFVINVDNETECFLETDDCIKLFDKNREISGKKVRIKGFLENEAIFVKEIGNISQ